MYGLIFFCVAAMMTVATGWASCITDSCHASVGDRLFVHGPVAAGMCRMCHGASETDIRTHSTEPAGFTAFTRPDTGRPLCLSCHSEALDGGVAHMDTQGMQCLECHDPHGGANRYFVRSAQ